MKTEHSLTSAGLSRLTFTRFIAAMIVVIFHFGSSLWPFSSEALRWFSQQGPTAVSYFYCLSGFIMAIAYPADSDKTLNKRSFWLARFARIYPCFILAVMFGTYYYAEATLSDTLQILVGFQPWNEHLSHANPPAWSIGVEAFFYLLFPFTLAAFKKSRIKITAIVVVAIWVATMMVSAKQMTSNGGPPLTYFNLYNPLMHVNEFFIGVLIGSILIQRKENPLNLLHPIVPFVVLCGILIARSSNGFPNIPGVHFANGALAPVFIWLIASIASSKPGTLTLFNHKFFILLGESSYAMYILHYPLRLWFITNIPESLKAQPLTELALYFCTLIAASIIIHLAFEAPLRTLIRKGMSKDSKPKIHIGERASAE